MKGKIYIMYSILVLCILIPACKCKVNQDALPSKLFRLPLIDYNVASTEGDMKNTGHVVLESLLKPVEYKTPEANPHAENVCNGACISAKKCSYYKGISSGKCLTSDPSVCCEFRRSCHDIGMEKISFFESPNYPEMSNDTSECSYSIFPSQNVCALKIKFLDFEMKKPYIYRKTFKCIYDSMFILNTLDDEATERLCQVENHTIIVRVKEDSTKPIRIIFITQGNSHKWKLKVTQIDCKGLMPWKNSDNCGREISDADDNENQVLEYVLEEDDPSLNTDAEDQIYPYIVNGQNASQLEFPWMVSLQSNGHHFCGASIINEQFLLTAAHCVALKAYRTPEQINAVVGDYLLNSTEDGNEKIYQVSEIITSFHYKTFFSMLNDIAILKLKTPITFSPQVQPICLPSVSGYETTGLHAVVSGWGRKNASDTGSTGGTLQKGEVEIISNENCQNLLQKAYSKTYHRKFNHTEMKAILKLGFTETQLCVVSTNTSSCFGDSGGPLIVQDTNSKWVQVGIVSYGISKCRVSKTLPISYTRVSQYLRFISIAMSDE